MPGSSALSARYHSVGQIDTPQVPGQLASTLLDPANPHFSIHTLQHVCIVEAGRKKGGEPAALLTSCEVLHSFQS